MRKSRSRGPSAVTAGILALLVILPAIFYGFTKYNPFHNPMEIQAAFKTVSDIKAGSAVRVAGVNVGKVKKVEAVAGDKGGAGAIVTMEIEDRGLPLHEDLTMKVRPRIFLEGNWFIDVTPGSPSAPLVADGDLIPVQQTAAPVQFGQILEALQSDTREDVRVVLDEYGRALANGGAKGYNRSIPYWKSAFRDSAIVNEATLGQVEHDLSNYIKGADRFARGLDADPEALKSLITDLATTGQAFASEEQRLSDTIEELPKLLIVGQRALGDLNDAFPSLRRLIVDLRPAVRSSGPALDATLPLVKQLRQFIGKPELGGLIDDLEPLIEPLVEVNEGGVPLQKELRLLSSCGNEVLIPWRNDKIPDTVFPASGKVFQEQVKWLPGIAAESRGFDANGQFVKSLANGAEYAYPLGNGSFMTSGAPIQGVNPPRRDQAPPLRKDVPCETQQRPDLRSQPGQPPTAKKINFGHPDVKAAEALAKTEALDWLKDEISSRKLGIKVDDDLLAPSQIPTLQKALPRR
jgi:ABC-type transporter Mla subunit MlaD